MAEKQKSKVKADIKRNRLYITLPSIVNKMEIQKIYTDVRFSVADLKPGFDVITDLTHCTVGHLNGLSTLRKIMDYLVINEMGRVIRIVGNMNVILRQLLAIASKFQSYIPIYVNTHEEAEEELMCPVKPKGLRFQLKHRQITYSVDQTEGTGCLVDISISGCAIQEPTIALSVDAEISLGIPLYREENKLSSFAVTAKVVWVQENKFAVQFLHLDDDQQTVLFKCLVNEGRRDIA